MAALIDFISEKQANNETFLTLNETATIQALVYPILSMLEWNIWGVEEVAPQYKSHDGQTNGLVDFALCVSGLAKVFIEVKAAGVDLENHQAQLLRYAYAEGVKLAILTNGITWWFYLPLIEATWERRRFYSIDILQQSPDEVCSRFTAFLSKSNVLSGQAQLSAEKLFESAQKEKRIREMLPQAWLKILSDPESLLVDLLNDELESISGFRAKDSQVAEFLKSWHESNPNPVKTFGAEAQTVYASASERPVVHRTRSTINRRRSELKSRKTRLDQLCTAGWLTEGETLYFRDVSSNRLGIEFAAKISGNGLIWGQEFHTMTSLAAVFLKRLNKYSESIRGPIYWYTKDGVSITELWQQYMQASSEDSQ